MGWAPRGPRPLNGTLPPPPYTPPLACCLQDGGRPAAAGAGGAAAPWRSSTSHRSDVQPRVGAAAASSRFDTSIGGRNWREEEREAAPPPRRDARWGDGDPPAASRQYAEPHNPAWSDAPARGRGRGVEVDSWKLRNEPAAEWRGGVGGGETGGGWRTNDRWGGGGGAPGACLGIARVLLVRYLSCCWAALR